MDEWVKLDVIGPDCEINRLGEVRRKEITLGGHVFHDFIRKQSITKHGYKYLAFIDDDGNQKNKTIHRLVALTFIPNPENKPFVNHIDGNKTNNNVSNLEWVTPSENSQHAFDNGLINIPRNEDNKLSVLTNNQVREIKKRIANGDKQRDIAFDYNVHYSLISHIKAGRKWGDII